MNYDRCYFFRLIDEDGNIFNMEDEPQGWDKVQVYLTRDRTWHGLNYEYTDGNIDLIFDCVSGKDFIEAIYQEQGVNGLILLEFGYVLKDAPDTSEHIEYTGKLNLSTRKIIKENISCSVERSGLHDIVKSRWDTKVNLFSGSDLNNNAIVPLAPYQLQLHSKKLINNFTKKYSSPEGTKSFTEHGGDYKFCYFSFNTTSDNAENSNIQATVGTSLGSSSSNPLIDKLYWMSLEADGSFTFNIKLSYVFAAKLLRKSITISVPRLSSYKLSHFLIVVKPDGTYRSRIEFSKTSGFSIDNQFLSEKTVNVELNNYKVEAKAGDQIYFYAFLELTRKLNYGSPIGFGAYIQTQAGLIDVVAETFTEPSYCKAILVHESISRCAKLITGQDNIVYSDFFGREDLGYGQNGCGALNMITNGFEVRKFDFTNPNYKPPTIALSALLKSLNSIFCLGMAYEKIDGTDKIRIEQRDYFYQDVEILELTDVSSYEERVASDLIFNNIDIGYKKYLDEGIRLLDEFNTQHQYLGPIKRFDNPFSELSELVGSGYAIETTRRYQFKATAQDSTSYDDDNFFIAVKAKEPTVIDATFYTKTGGFMIYSSGFNFIVGQKITIAGSLFNDGQKTVLMVNKVFSFNYVYFKEPTFAETATITIASITEAYITEKDEAFSKVENLVSPETSYNLRHTPKRMLYAWSKWLNSSYFYSGAGEIIKNTFYKQNGALVTKLKETENCTLGDIERANIQEKGDVVLATFHEKDNIFIPEYCTFKTELTFDQLDLIKRAMTGQNTGFDYGYITVKIPGGKLKGWIYDMAYSPVTKLVSFTLLKKLVVLDNSPGQVNCLEFSDYTFDDFEATTIPKSIEKCRFENFN